MSRLPEFCRLRHPSRARRFAAVAASALYVACAGASAAFGQERSGTAPAPTGEKQYRGEAEGGRRPLMRLIDQTPLAQPLQDARINVFGHVEGSYTYNFAVPALDANFGRVFDFEHNEVLLNQIDLNIERPVNLTGSEFDLGFRVEMMYGSDARFLHANGLFDDNDFFSGPENQFDLTQAYVDLAVPVGNGLRLRAGKFLFFKQVDPNASVFYSHSYTFGGALPFTHTGATALYKLSEQWSVEAGFSRGWGQALEDNNDALDFLGRVRYDMSDRTSFTVSFITGPELDDDNGNYRTAVDATLSHALSDNLTVLLDVVYGIQAQAPAVGGDQDADYYGVAGYAVYRLNDRFSLAGRLEYFRDDEGFVTGVGQISDLPYHGLDLFEATVGVTIAPFPEDTYGQNLKIRPEIRWDYSDEKFFDGFTRDDQLTAAVDVIFNF